MPMSSLTETIMYSACGLAIFLNLAAYVIILCSGNRIFSWDNHTYKTHQKIPDLEKGFTTVHSRRMKMPFQSPLHQKQSSSKRRRIDLQIHNSQIIRIPESFKYNESKCEIQVELPKPEPEHEKEQQELPKQIDLHCESPDDWETIDCIEEPSECDSLLG